MKKLNYISSPYRSNRMLKKNLKKFSDCEFKKCRVHGRLPRRITMGSPKGSTGLIMIESYILFCEKCDDWLRKPVMDKEQSIYYWNFFNNNKILGYEHTGFVSGEFPYVEVNND